MCFYRTQDLSYLNTPRAKIATILQVASSNVFFFDDFFAMIQISMKSDITGTGGRLNKKDGLTRYGDSHVKDKTS